MAHNWLFKNYVMLEGKGGGYMSKRYGEVESVSTSVA